MQKGPIVCYGKNRRTYDAGFQCAIHIPQLGEAPILGRRGFGLREYDFINGVYLKYG